MTHKIKVVSYVPDDQQPIECEPIEQDITYTLTTDHAASSYGVPVVVDADGLAYGPDDHLPLACNRYAWEAVVRAIANQSGYPDYEARYALSEKFSESRSRSATPVDCGNSPELDAFFSL